MKDFVKQREFILLVFIVVAVAVITAVNPAFIDPLNVEDILINVSYVTVAALGMTMILITGGIDVSVGAVLTVLSLSCGQMALWEVPMPICLLLTVLGGVLLGCINGFIIVKLRVPPMICTLAVTSIYRGAVLVLTDGKWIVGLPSSFGLIGKGRLAGIPISILIMLAVLLWCVWFMQKSKMGRNIYAVGSNPEAARIAGLRVDGVLIGTYAIAGALLGISSILYCTRLRVIQSDIGEDFHVQLIAASLIGGTSILGGSGRPIGTFLGALSLTIFRSALVYMRIDTLWEQAMQGALILIATLIGVYNFSGKKKRKAVAESET